MAFTLERHEFSRITNSSTMTGSAQGMAQALMEDLGADGGMTLLYPTGGIMSSTNVAVYESNMDMDPLADRGEKWRVRIETDGSALAGKGYIRINMGTEHQIPSDGGGVTAESENKTSGNLAGPKGDYFDGGSSARENVFLSEEYFYSEDGTDQGASPLSYRMSVSNHGIAFCAWRNAYDNAGDKFAWFVVQRPVDPTDGTILSDYYAPVFCVYSVGGGGPTVSTSKYSPGIIIDPEGIQRFVVRETDVHAPTKSASAIVPQRDINPIINPAEQVSISVDNKYIITFPSGLNTQRRAYKHELDMLAYTSADVISQDSDVNVTVFGESEPRTYKAMQANGEYNTGMRILLLIQGAGIPAPTPAP